jgi:tetratricopeptide (TPR) repeat protein
MSPAQPSTASAGSHAEAFKAALDRHLAGDLAVAKGLYRALLARGPARPMAADIQTNLGAILRSELDLDAAEACLRSAIELAPNNHGAHLNLGNLLYLQQRLEAAEVAYTRAMALRPGEAPVPFNLGLVHLAQGRYQTGWPLYELRPDHAATVMRKLSFPEWDGSPLDGRSVFVWREQGYGDELQMARFIPQLKAAGAGRVTVAPTVALLRLFSELSGVDQVVRCVGDVVIPPHDVWVLPFSLPKCLDVTLPTLPSAPYLRAPPEARAKWAGFAPKGAIGVVWHGNRVQPAERYRGLPSPDLLKPLAAFGELVDLQEPRGDFADTAAILEQLDLVVTTDTAMAHLAGAMGVPCWVMLAKLGVDWRWMADRADSPWYPSVRLWRQSTAGDWDPVISAMVEELARSRR